MKQHIREKPATFRQVMDSVAAANGRRLMIKARQLSRVAKLVPQGQHRLELYRKKAICLLGLLTQCRHGVLEPHPNNKDPELLLVKLAPLGSLHTKRQWLREAESSLS